MTEPSGRRACRWLDRGYDAFVYRPGRKEVPTGDFLARLREELQDVERREGEARRDAAVDALVSAGEIEAALADVDSPSAPTFARLTDQLASTVLGETSSLDGGRSLPCGTSLDGGRPMDDWHSPAHGLPPELSISIPEGFAYYALHPESYARAVDAFPSDRPVLVVGIRSIGTTLSAMVLASLRKRGVVAERRTVRPSGEPYARKLDVPPTLVRAFERTGITNTRVLVVDEGPGLSGSTFLAVAEAVERCGVDPGRIAVVCSHDPQPEKLLAENAARRWARFATIVARAHLPSPEGSDDLSGGRWRSALFPNEASWPAVWPSVERVKHATPEGRFFKFEGFGSSGRDSLVRSEALADAGMALPVRAEHGGFQSWEFLRAPRARPMQRSDLDDSMVVRLGRYCALRASSFPVDPMRVALETFEAMVEKNRSIFSGARRPRKPRNVERLRVERPAIVDGRTMPHEWLRTADGNIYKTDGSSHGDDHFFPGPCDVAWDLAGVIVEWQLDASAVERLLDVYERTSGDRVRKRLRAWIEAYACFGFGRAAMAYRSARPDEAARWRTALSTYASVLAGGG